MCQLRWPVVGTTRSEAVIFISYTPEQEALRIELRAYFTELMTTGVTEECAAGDTGGPHCMEAVRKMGRDGWLGIGWPTEYGGQGRTDIEQFIFFDEAWRAGAPLPFLSINTVGRTIMEFGSEAQKQFFLPKILAGELHFSIGYTEPNAGTDLASLRTTAVKDGDEWRINGQKIYTSLASYADYIWLAARTDPDAPKHQGITIFAVPTTDPGFTMTKISTMVNASTFNTFYDDVRVGDDAIIGEVHHGWNLITNQLNYERVSLGPPGMIEGPYDDVVAWAQRTKLADGRRVIDQPWVQLNLARVHAKLEFVKLINWKVAASGGANPADASGTKVFSTEFYTEAFRLLMEIVGPTAALQRDEEAAALNGRLERGHQGVLILTFGGGTNEIQRDLVALFGLGLPRVPRT
ncbi:MAG TPA: acyl-CoA dehydrogenase family protein [Acidimicrobiales bacterium]|nr:acyl-CoA dehydrogenase family protein [Acidimicrobiales bacterium]